MVQGAYVPLISVVLPARDAAHTVERALASVRAQTLQAWELIAIDDGSVDATGKILAAAASQDLRIRVITQSRLGLVSALNAGLAAARGTWIARMDADDVSEPDRFAEQLAFAAKPENRAIGVVSCLVAFGGNRAANFGYALHVDWINTLLTPEEIALNRFVESPLAHPSVMFRRELVAGLGGYRAGDFPEDYELWLRWLHAGVVMAKVPRMLLTWHDDPNRASRVDARYDPEAFFRMKAEWIAKLIREPRSAGQPPRPVWIWGAGRPTRKRAAFLETHGIRIAGYIDVDRKKTTPALGGAGRPVILPSALPPPGHALVLGYVTSRGARDFIRTDLLGRGYREGIDFWMCA